MQESHQFWRTGLGHWVISCSLLAEFICCCLKWNAVCFSVVINHKTLDKAKKVWKEQKQSANFSLKKVFLAPITKLKKKKNTLYSLSVDQRSQKHYIYTHTSFCQCSFLQFCGLCLIWLWLRIHCWCLLLCSPANHTDVCLPALPRWGGVVFYSHLHDPMILELKRPQKWRRLWLKMVKSG